MCVVFLWSRKRERNALETSNVGGMLKVVLGVGVTYRLRPHDNGRFHKIDPCQSAALYRPVALSMIIRVKIGVLKMKEERKLK